MNDDFTLRKWVITRVQTAVVTARSEEDAVFMGEEKLDYIGPDTEDVQVEELGSDGLRLVERNLED